jgi:hypothetical protein
MGEACPEIVERTERTHQKMVLPRKKAENKIPEAMDRTRMKQFPFLLPLAYVGGFYIMEVIEL